MSTTNFLDKTGLTYFWGKIKAAIPTKVSDLTNDSGYITGYTETDPTVPAWAKTNTKPSYTAAEISSGIASGEATYITADADVEEALIDLDSSMAVLENSIPPTMSILSYGSSTWNDFLAAYQTNTVVYCRASSNSNPASGSQTRLAFMAYVNNATNPTSVEFQYYRSVSSHSATQQGDQVYVYTLTSANNWTVTTREASSKIASTNGVTQSYASGTITLGHSNSVTAQTTEAFYPFTYDAQGHITGSGTALTAMTEAEIQTAVAAGWGTNS